MKTKLIVLFAALFLAMNIRADQIYKIEVGSDYQKYSNDELQRRVWELERAVSQLQQRVFQLEGNHPLLQHNWICKVNGMEILYTGTGTTKAAAEAKAIESCKTKDPKQGFFCKEAKCEQ